MEQYVQKSRGCEKLRKRGEATVVGTEQYR